MFINTRKNCKFTKKKKSILFEFNYGYKVNIVYQFFFIKNRKTINNS